ncbi:hypothetical protein vB_PsyM_KIL4_0134 [Pseudomonas phage vB_PsyM_KIL4]|uniref:Uncharacterized protein n=3 Tax=Flaumdravirus TaxID=2560133 RepID=A0A142IF53_9CAUD|nr:hypothetical protein BH774_gp073 [Pseudomonas phage vB_PsyM_KIL1]YP_009616811.1 hypothetical protein FDI83_gp079 [Pseudomonas phage vB_PsyM_KIL4]AMR57376.1 hypothetical protein vB_PsyM_KIL1_0129 [Pseudomonas phage vB_PsyM_KIL1]AMR57858.1 hypothetical protein vB_PsyM_KIL4_0134 [Pseudomonas phage vB_PsyM_KIL4]AMR58028.1 hypothetical protein vB_PsyM_KIL5_0137 [Pseudomonas phage vB_PsyM_KIL5]
MYTHRDDAIADMRYAKGLGETALKQHYLIWRGATLPLGSEEAEYALAVMEIYEKLDTEDCLLKGA